MKSSIRSIYRVANGFTIVELLVVIVVISILATITIVSYTGISKQAIIATITSDLDNAFKKFKLYQVENSGFPTGIELNCVTPVTSTNICLRPSSNNQYTLATVNNSAVGNQIFCLTILNTAINTKYSITNDGAQTLGTCPHTLTIIAGANGTVTGGGIYGDGSIQTITATPNVNYQFTSWTGDAGCSGIASHAITIDADKTCTANFTIITYSLAISAGANGSVNTGVNGTYNSGTSQTITATPINSFYLFSNWSGDSGCSGTASHVITIDASKACTANFSLDPNWYAGVAATALAGKYVRSADLGSQYAYRTTTAAVASPQGAIGLDPSYASNMALVSPQTNPGVDFSEYPAQNACKAIGGRLPNMQEMTAMYTNKASYGNNFVAAFYWASTEYPSNYGYVKNMGDGTTGGNTKTSPGRFRCVSG